MKDHVKNDRPAETAYIELQHADMFKRVLEFYKIKALTDEIGEKYLKELMVNCSLFSSKIC